MLENSLVNLQNKLGIVDPEKSRILLIIGDTQQIELLRNSQVDI